MKLLEQDCPNCDRHISLRLSDEAAVAFCPCCGHKFLLGCGRDEKTISKNINITKNIYNHKRYTDDADIIRAKSDARKERWDFWQPLIGVGILIAMAVAILVIPNLRDKAAQESGKLNAGYYKDLIGKDYETVEAHFEAAGFKNIELIDLDDSGLAFWKEGKVDTISVGGDTNFDSYDWFSPDTQVVISYR